ncbi:MAG: 50S ribosomal protein L25/general stress protein Ctc [Legionellales bacterium RIFCSPHIGHO2_12_FULL_37_14]|nr:MAG: 50S ribosomal protein L25/general stress protein Ctc [Legionellales bacterium RIFCSPHIGHO2_12_FULL_37_14]
MTIVLEAEVRTDIGKGSSRRQRRLENKVPAIIYGGKKDPQNISFMHNHLIKALEDESIYASVFNVKVNKTVENVILKDLQRHPFKPKILHLDLQRVSDTDVLVKMIPIHFLNHDTAKGLEDGGILNHNMSQVEVKCKVKDLPPYIEVDVGNMELNDVIHLSQITLPKGVELTVDVTDQQHDFPVVSIHLPKVVQIEEEVQEEAAAEGEEGEVVAGAEGEAAAAAGEGTKSPESKDNAEAKDAHSAKPEDKQS